MAACRICRKASILTAKRAALPNTPPNLSKLSDDLANARLEINICMKACGLQSFSVPGSSPESLIARIMRLCSSRAIAASLSACCCDCMVRACYFPFDKWKMSNEKAYSARPPPPGPDGVEAPCLSQGGVLIRPETLNENVPTTSFIASVSQVSIRWMVLLLRRPGEILDGFQEVSSGDRMDGVANLVMEVPDPLQDCFDLFHLHLPFHQTSDLGLGFPIPSGRSRNRECGFAGAEI
ncbi:hypothetical protein M5K25_024445 [Dendrobium thyrsiflorum]|uniref:Uncharacterized protein n=1 Tax=Dendrobium thyrsiflorum TaxID=117978 RepID=A0ABD0U1Y1_DENTH